MKAQKQKIFFLKETKSKKILLRGQLSKRVFKKGLNDLLQSKQGSSENKNHKKNWSVTIPTPLGKISSPRFQLILKQVWVLYPKKILALPSCFILGVITPLNSEKLNGFLSGPPFRLFQYPYWPFSVGEIWLHVNALMRYMLFRVVHTFPQLWDVEHVVDIG